MYFEFYYNNVFWILLKYWILYCIGILNLEFHWNIVLWILLKYWIMNSIEILDFEFYWNIGFWIKLKYWILNCIEILDFKYNWNIGFWIPLKYWILNFINFFLKCIECQNLVCHMLTKVLLLQYFLFQPPNKMLSYKNKIKFRWNIGFWILLKYCILNIIEILDFEYNWNIGFWIS